MVSVIVPVYNAEKYVGETIQSFLNQTYQNFELILIDDGSTDESLSVLQNYQEQSKEKILVYTQENKGIAKTRNRGIREANGKYIMFADNDDYVERDYIETLVNEIEKQNADIVICSCRKVDQNGRTLYEQILTQDEWAKFRMITPWAKIIRRDFVIENNLEFGDFKIGEDIYFTITAYNLTPKIGIIPYIGYNWVQRATSVSNTVQKTKVASPLPMLEALVKRNNKYYNISKDYFEYFIIKMLVWNLYYICDTLDMESIKQYNMEYFSWLEKWFPDYHQNKLVAFDKPHGEELFVRWLVAIFVKMAGMRITILKIIKILKKYIKMK